MKLKQKLLVTAVAAAAAFVAPVANAKIEFGANGELFLTVYDLGLDLSSEADNRAYVLDLGGYIAANGYANPFGTINDWSTPSGYPPVKSANKESPDVGGAVFTIAPDANLQSFLAATDDLSRLEWNIVAGDNSGNRRLLTTSSGITSPGTYQEWRTLVSRIGTYLPYPNNNGIVENGSVLLNGPTAGIPAWGNNFAGMGNSGTINFQNTGHIGDQLGFYLMSEHVSIGSNTTQPLIQQYMGMNGEQAYWHLDASGTLTYNVPAIPEPSEYALMLAGLGMLGFMARRRLANRG